MSKHASVVHDIDLSVETIRRLAKGKASNLPTFMVHDNDKWPYPSIQLDSQQRIHCRRQYFETVIATAIPVKPGLWHGIDVQEFSIDLRDDQLDGDGSGEDVTQEALREFTEDRNVCPECGSRLEDLPDVTENKLRNCTNDACNYVEGLGTERVTE